jgi:O-antigen ligase
LLEESKTVLRFSEEKIEEPGSFIWVPLSGRTEVWKEGIKLFWQSPVLGYGFHSDRLKLGAHMHNSLLHVMVQTGLLGTIPFVAALILGWIALIKVFIVRRTLPQVHRYFVVQAGALLMFLSLRTIPESTGAFFGVDLLLLIPILLYLYIVSVNYGGADNFKFRLPQKLVW